MLGFSRLQRNRLRSSRKPTPQMHGRSRGSSCAYEYYQLPLGAYAKVHDWTPKAELDGTEEIEASDRQEWHDWGSRCTTKDFTTGWNREVEKERYFG